MKRLFFLLAGFIIWQLASSQEELPDFSVHKAAGGRVIISWTHEYPIVKQISIQRSSDSLSYFKTIATMPDPTIKQNGYADSNPANDSMFYRIFVMWDLGKYMVTKSKRATVDSNLVADTISKVSKTTIVQPPTASFLPAGFVPSRYIFTSADRYVRVELPLDNRKYDIKFFADNNQPLFELEDIKETRFKLDRSYFYTAGYINFELYADGKLIEKHKLFLPKEF